MEYSFGLYGPQLELVSQYFKVNTIYRILLVQVFFILIGIGQVEFEIPQIVNQNRI